MLSGVLLTSMSAVTNSALRVLYLGLGVFFLGIGFVGIVLPLIPTIVPVLIAAFFFSKSSERFDRWLLKNRLFGGIVKDWRAGAGFTLRIKAIGIAAIITSFTISVVFIIDVTPIRIGLVALAIALVIYLARFPTKRLTPARAQGTKLLGGTPALASGRATTQDP